MIGRLGGCSWSLRPGSPEELAGSLKAIGVPGVQLALGPIGAGDWDLNETRRALDDAGIVLLSGMMETEGEDYSTLDTIRETGGVRPDAHGDANRAIAERDAAIAADLGLTHVTFHAGFLPHHADDPLREIMLGRLRGVHDLFAARGVRVAFETGQESAETLLEVLSDLNRPDAGVNFDPANMLLYGMGDPIDALRALADHVVQIHIKDADPSATSGQWGAERTAGEGSVDWPRFMEMAKALPRAVDLVIEREAGEARAQDIATASELVRGLLEDHAP